MKIIVLDGYTGNPGDLSWNEFEKLGEFICYDRTPENDEVIIAERIGDADVVITNRTPVSSAVMEHCPNLHYIGVLATDYSMVDIAAAKQCGIVVTNVPGYGTASISQHAIALLLEVCHRVGAHDESVKNGDWDTCEDSSYWLYPLIELDKKTLGIIGLGKTGKATAAVGSAFGMKVLATDPAVIFDASEDTIPVEICDMETLLRESDVIMLHCPPNPATQRIINRKTIKKMKDGVIIISVGDDMLIDAQDLAAALNSGKVYAAGLDGLPDFHDGDNPLMTAKNCIITPRIGWASKESRARLMDIAVESLAYFAEGNAVNVVNS